MHHIDGCARLAGERCHAMYGLSLDKWGSRVVPRGKAALAVWVGGHQTAAQNPGNLDVFTVGAKNALAAHDRLGKAEQEAVIDIGQPNTQALAAATVHE